MKRRSLALVLALSSVGALGVAAVHRVALADDAVVAPHTCGAHAMGPHEWVGAALATIELRDDQRDAVAKLKADLETQAAPMRAAHEAITEAIAASVEAGALDHERIDGLVRNAQAAMAANRPLMEQAANRLHELLDANQRQALVAAMRGGMHGGHGFFHHAMRGDRPNPMEQVATDLGLSEDQISTIKQKLETLHDGDHGPGRDGMRAHFDQLRAIGEAFQSDTFDAHALGVADHLGGDMHGHLAHHLALVEAALPVLTSAQRTELAGMIRAGRFEHGFHP